MAFDVNLENHRCRCPPVMMTYPLEVPFLYIWIVQLIRGCK
ncbi:hypothetical protein C5167_000180 [Papaver somniferum]|uniref:Uncharacterized protein n=1 Tax=Papaver somniferum TaxID=3469 RepID=A0A4Y7KVP0_PAPSO|nr:hypothetical protein C5167_000180 [Papaver somniferum]